MDGNLAAAIITSIATAASTAGVAITALISQNSRVSRVETKLDETNTTLYSKFDELNTRLNSKLDEINTTLHLLNGSLHEIDKRLGIVEDRIFNR